MPRPGHDTVHLVTGFPAFTARRLLRRALEVDPGAFFYLLVQPKFLGTVDEELRLAGPGARSRVEVLEGDAAAMDFGLSGKEFLALAEEVDFIDHLASIYYLGVDHATAKRVNVGGVREAIEFARACKHLRRLAFFSTAMVSGDRTGVVLEEDLDRGQRFRNDYEETKFKAEKILRAAAERHRLPVTILRPSIIVGDSKTGEIDRLDGPYLLVQLILSSPTRLTVPLPARGDAPLHLVPIDFVVEATLAILTDERSAGKTYHLVDPHPLPARQVFERIAKIANRVLPRGFVPANFSRVLFRTPGLERFRNPLAFVETLATDVTYSCIETDEILRDKGVICPPFDAYAEHLVGFVRDRQKKRTEAEVHDPLF